MTAALHQELLQRSKPRRLFITGTDTGVGKTRVASSLLAAWTRNGRRLAGMKPIETGCAALDGTLVSADGAALWRAGGRRHDLALVAPLRLAAPASPAAAAALAGTTLDLPAIDRAFAALAGDSDLIVIEGAGGLLVPITDQLLMADLALRFEAPLVIVARASLGTVNHTLLTIEAARRRGLAVAGVILNRQRALVGVDEASNPTAIASFGDVPLLGTLPFRPGTPDEDELAELAERHLALNALWPPD